MCLSFNLKMIKMTKWQNNLKKGGRPFKMIHKGCGPPSSTYSIYLAPSLQKHEDMLFCTKLANWFFLKWRRKKIIIFLLNPSITTFFLSWGNSTTPSQWSTCISMPYVALSHDPHLMIPMLAHTMSHIHMMFQIWLPCPHDHMMPNTMHPWSSTTTHVFR